MKRNVALLVLDTVRKDYFDRYATRLQTRANVSFEQCRAASSWSVPSHASMFTGDLPTEHGFHAEHFDAESTFAALGPNETFVHDLSQRTVGVSANAYINTAFGADSLFDEFHDFSIGSHVHESLFPEGLTVQDYMSEATGSTMRRYLGFLRACATHDHPVLSVLNGVWSQTSHTLERLPLPMLVDDGATVISKTVDDAFRGETPAFVFANYMDAHTPLRTVYGFDDRLHSAPHSWSSKNLDKWDLNMDRRATEEYTRHYRELYGAAIDYLDRRVADLVDDLLAREPNTSIIVTADHGHNLGYEAENGLFQHTGSMSEGVMHVPLVIINPPAGYPERVSEYFSQLELGELVVGLSRGEPFDPSLAGGPIPAETVGLLGAGDSTWGREFTTEEFAHWNRMIRCVYDGDRKFEWTSVGKPRTFRLDPAEPCWQELVDTGTPPPGWATDLFETDIETYKAHATESEQEMGFDSNVENQLRKLGYL